MSKANKILMCGDDPRVPSGVGTQMRYIGHGLSELGYEVVVLGGIQKRGNDDRQPTEWEGMKIYPVEGYGNSILLRNVITMEQPDMVFLFTDPRYWIWAWMMEAEIRTQIPIIYYNLWDDSPVQPNHYNKDYYKSNDGLIQISKQTNIFIYNILKEDEEVELDITKRCHSVLDLAHKHAGMQVSREAYKDEGEKNE